VGLLERLAFWNWPRPAGPPDLTLDLSRPSLGEIRPGESQAVLARRLGPPASFRQMKRRGLWIYPGWGITFQVERGRVAGFSATVLGVEGTPPRLLGGQWRPYPGEVVLRGGGGRRGADRLTPEAVWETLGAPQQMDEGAEEVVLHYRLGAWGMDVEFLPDSRFTHARVFVTRHESR
jgi:hypothetical protein